jgi:hypothetical protein
MGKLERGRKDQEKDFWEKGVRGKTAGVSPSLSGTRGARWARSWSKWARAAAHMHRVLGKEHAGRRHWRCGIAEKQIIYLAAVLFAKVGRVHDDATSAAEEAPDMILKTMPMIYQRAVVFQTRNERFSISSSIRRHTTTHTQQTRALSSRLAAATAAAAAATTAAAAAQPKQGSRLRVITWYLSHGRPPKTPKQTFQTVFVY